MRTAALPRDKHDPKTWRGWGLRRGYGDVCDCAVKDASRRLSITLRKAKLAALPKLLKVWKAQKKDRNHAASIILYDVANRFLDPVQDRIDRHEPSMETTRAFEASLKRLARRVGFPNWIEVG